MEIGVAGVILTLDQPADNPFSPEVVGIVVFLVFSTVSLSSARSSQWR